jgi:hypothetical protein
MSWVLRSAPRIFALRPGKLRALRAEAKGVNHTEFVNVRECETIAHCDSPGGLRLRRFGT